MKTRTRKSLAALFFALTLVMAGCGSSNHFADSAPMDNGYGYTESYNSKAEAEGMFDMAVTESAADDSLKPSEPSLGAANTSGTFTEGRKIIRNSHFQIETKEFDASVDALNALCVAHGAYIENSETYGAGGRARSAYYTIRVPVEHYEAFIGKTDSLGTVTSSGENNEDVSERYYDTEARLQSAELREERVLEILKHADLLDDVLALERELADIRYEIESYTGTLRRYDSLVSYATVSISLSETSAAVQVRKEELSFGERLSVSFGEGINNFVDDVQDLIVELSYNVIGIALWLVVIVILIPLIRRARKKRKQKMRVPYTASPVGRTPGAEPAPAAQPSSEKESE